MGVFIKDEIFSCVCKQADWADDIDISAQFTLGFNRDSIPFQVVINWESFA